MMQKILIVEDEAWLADQQKMLLEKQGFLVQIASHAYAAIVQVDDFKPDVIILDVLLPGGTAFGLLHELQSYDDTGELPIIICSSMASELKMDDLRPYGVRRILDKATMRPEDIVGAVRNAV